MKLTAMELAQVDALIAEGKVKLRAAGSQVPSGMATPVSYVELVARRRANIGKPSG